MAMRILLRYLSRHDNGSVECRDEIFQGNTLPIGRASGQGIYLPDRQIALRHADITQTNSGQLHIKPRQNTSGLTINQVRTPQHTLQPNDLIEIGSSTLKVLPKPADFDGAIEIETCTFAMAENAQGPAQTLTLEQTRLSKRRLAWVSVIAITLISLIIPLILAFSPNLAEHARQLPVPDDGQWNPGPLHKAHQNFSENCHSCHTTPFFRVQDTQCIACHDNMGNHADPVQHPLEDIQNTRCATCHKDHKEPSALIRIDQALCVDCHADLQDNTAQPSTLVNQVTDFEDDHPPFKIQLPKPSKNGWEYQRLLLTNPEKTPVEQSNLKFPHDVHLRETGIPGPDGYETMACIDCHQPDSGGKLMLMVTMEKDCQRCHQLDFDSNPNITRSLPHEDPTVVMQVLEEFYARRLLDGKSLDTTADNTIIRRPGAKPPASSNIPADILTQARQQAQAVGDDIIGKRICAECHIATPTTNPSNFYQRWEIAPVALGNNWMPKAVFDHSSHQAMQCDTCHAAQDSSSSSDILMPDIDNCRTCHGGEHTNLLPSPCIDCHVFHNNDHGLMYPPAKPAQPTTPQGEQP